MRSSALFLFLILILPRFVVGHSVDCDSFYASARLDRLYQLKGPKELYRGELARSSHAKLLEAWGVTYEAQRLGPIESFSLSRVLKGYSAILKAHILRGRIKLSHVIWPALSFLPRETSRESAGADDLIWARPGIDELPDLRTHRYVDPGILGHEEWISLMARGLYATSLKELNHELAHFTAYASSPEYLELVSGFYRESFEILRKLKGKDRDSFIKRNRRLAMVFEEALFIPLKSKKLDRVFVEARSYVPIATNLRTLSEADFIKRVQTLLYLQQEILEPWGGLERQFGYFDSSRREKIEAMIVKAASRRIGTYVPSFWIYTPNLGELLEQISVALQLHMNSSELERTATLHFMIDRFARFQEAYLIGLEAGLDAEQVIRDLTPRGIERHSATDRLLRALCLETALRLSRELPPRPFF